MTSPVALYVHVPFCLSVCPYCDFVVYSGRGASGPDSQTDRLVRALVTEMHMRAPATRHPLRSVYVGGGTPSLLSAGQVALLLSEADDAFGLAPHAEIALECNPGPRDRGDLAGFHAAGVNRLSIGAQSLDDAELRALGRRHSAADIRLTFDAARRAGFDNVSLDLLYDVPGQTVSSWRASLHGTIDLGPDHISAYALTLETEGIDSSDHLPPRQGALRWRRNARRAQDEDRAAGSYELADELLSAAGFEWYEISNRSLPGKESRHNIAYWTGDAWEAVGPGAHAFDGRLTRRWNAPNLEPYLVSLQDGRLPPGGLRTADAPEAAAERAILRLRTREGLSRGEAAKPEFRAALAWSRENGLIEPESDGAVRLTRRGRLLSNEVFERMLPASAAAAA